MHKWIGRRRFLCCCLTPCPPVFELRTLPPLQRPREIKPSEATPTAFGARAYSPYAPHQQRGGGAALTPGSGSARMISSPFSHARRGRCFPLPVVHLCVCMSGRFPLRPQPDSAMLLLFSLRQLFLRGQTYDPSSLWKRSPPPPFLFFSFLLSPLKHFWDFTDNEAC